MNSRNKSAKFSGSIRNTELSILQLILKKNKMVIDHVKYSYNLI